MEVYSWENHLLIIIDRGLSIAVFDYWKVCIQGYDVIYTHIIVCVYVYMYILYTYMYTDVHYVFINVIQMFIMCL